MAFYNEIFIEQPDGTLKHLGSCTGSDTPSYFDEVKSEKDFHRQILKLASQNGFWYNNQTKNHPFPWKTYKTSDNLIALKKTNRRWYEFWKPTHQVFVAVEKCEIEDPNKSYFIEISKWFGDSEKGVREYDKADLVLLDLPELPPRT